MNDVICQRPCYTLCGETGRMPTVNSIKNHVSCTLVQKQVQISSMEVFMIMSRRC